MTTLAGLKIKRHRMGQAPKLSRAALGAMVGVPAGTVQGWEEEGKVARPGPLTAMVELGIADPADWYRPALCARCERASDDPTIAACTHVQCPLAERRAA